MPRSSSALPLGPERSWLPRRYMLALVSFFGFANLYALRVNISLGIVAMTSNKTIVNANGSTIIEPGEFEWDSVVQGVILSSFFYGYIMTQVLGGWLFVYLGGKVLIGWGIGLASLLTIFTPFFARSSVYVLVTSRVFTGLFEGLVFPSMHGMWSKWAPPDERSRLVTISYSGCYFGTVAALPICGALADRIGWPSIFYVLGLLGLIWSVVWYWTVSDSPAQDKKISCEEKEFIEYTLGASFKSRSPGFKGEVPWMKIATSVPVWAIVAAHFTENWGFYTLLTELPTYLNDGFKFNMQKSGLLAALPYFAMGIVVQSGGFVADWLHSNHHLSTTAVRKIFTCAGFLTRALFLLVAAHSSSVLGTITSLTIAVGLGGLSFSGYAVNHIDIAPQYASLLMGISNTIATFPGILSPVLTGKIVRHKSPEEWQVVFHISSVLYVLGSLFYALFASGTIQSWAASEEEHNFLSSDPERSSTDDLLPPVGPRYQSVQDDR